MKQSFVKNEIMLKSVLVLCNESRHYKNKAPIFNFLYKILYKTSRKSIENTEMLISVAQIPTRIDRMQRTKIV